ncbi:MAG: alpha/beta hydrolase [Gammaproteobacteria bacterium]|nr:MAG: alpha/beta hydrolase [Gammaproteobacteria bacterium]
MQGAAPQWFQDAINSPRQTKNIDVEGARINYQVWGDKKKPALLLIHGNNAHSRWWDFIAPMLTNEYYVIATDLSGMGDSEARDAYSYPLYAKELIATLKAEGFEQATFVGHSFGARMPLVAAKLFPEYVNGIIMVDSGFSGMPPHVKERRNKRIYATQEEALSRFRLMPEQSCENQFILDYIAKHSIKQTPEGWTWKFDANLMSKLVRDESTYLPVELRCNISLIYGEHSAISSREDFSFEEIFTILNHEAPLVIIPCAAHHIFLDQPIAFVSTLRALLTTL